MKQKLNLKLTLFFLLGMMSFQSFSQGIFFTENPTVLKHTIKSGHSASAYDENLGEAQVVSGNPQFKAYCDMSTNTGIAIENLFTDESTIMVNHIVLKKLDNTAGLGSSQKATFGMIPAYPYIMPLSYSFFFSNRYVDIPPCTKITLAFEIYDATSNQLLVSNTVDIYIPPTYAGITASSLFTPDLVMHDEQKDPGIEPYEPQYWNWDYKRITQSPDIWNISDFNLSGTTHQNPMHSVKTPPNANFVGVKIFNRSCAATPAPGTFHAYWTIARLFEPWAHDWFNPSRGPYYANNSIDYTDPVTHVTTQKPLGNELTLADRLDYTSAETGVTIPICAAGGFNVLTAEWTVPDPKWYINSSLPIQIAHNTTQPVICLTARIDEPWKTGNGYYSDPPYTSNTKMVDYASANNNVVTRNTYILNSKNGYKRLPEDFEFSTSPKSGGGLILITPAEPVEGETPQPINIGIITDTTVVITDTLTSDTVITDSIITPIFNNHGKINLYLEVALWEKWLQGGQVGTNIQIVAPQIIQITDPQFASLNNISLNNDERYWMAVETEFDTENPPANDFEYSFSVGAINSETTSENPVMIGTPTHFFTTVLNQPKMEEYVDWEEGIETEGEFVGTQSIKNKSKSFFYVYPNPASADNLNLYLNSMSEETVSIQIFDMQGRIVKDNTTNIKSGNNTIKVDVSSLAPSQYIIRVNSAELSKYQLIQIK